MSQSGDPSWTNWVISIQFAVNVNCVWRVDCIMDQHYFIHCFLHTTQTYQFLTRVFVSLTFYIFFAPDWHFKCTSHLSLSLSNCRNHWIEQCHLRVPLPSQHRSLQRLQLKHKSRRNCCSVWCFRRRKGKGMNDALGLGLLIVKHLSHTPTISRHLILFFSILTSLILFLYYFFFSFLYGMAVNDNEFAAAVLRPPGGICDARWRGPPHP